MSQLGEKRARVEDQAAVGGDVTFAGAIKLAYPHQQAMTVSAAIELLGGPYQFSVAAQLGQPVDPASLGDYPRFGLKPFKNLAPEGQTRTTVYLGEDALPKTALSKLAVLDFAKKHDRTIVLKTGDGYYLMGPFAFEEGYVVVPGGQIVPTPPEGPGLDEMLRGFRSLVEDSSISAGVMQLLCQRFSPALKEGRYTQFAEVGDAIYEKDVGALIDLEGEAYPKVAQYIATATGQLCASMTFEDAVDVAARFRKLVPATAFLSSVPGVGLPLVPSARATYVREDGSAVQTRTLGTLVDDEVVVLRDARPAPNEFTKFSSDPAALFLTGHKVFQAPTQKGQQPRPVEGKRVSGATLKKLAAALQALNTSAAPAAKRPSGSAAGSSGAPPPEIEREPMQWEAEGL